MTAPLSAIADLAAKGLRATSGYYIFEAGHDADSVVGVAHDALREIVALCAAEKGRERVEAEKGTAELAKLSRALLGRDAAGNVVHDCTEAPT